MPYITEDRREAFKDGIIELFSAMNHQIDLSPGDLNYIFTVLIHAYVDIKGPNYRHYNDAVGALECCKLELYRRLIVPYEERKTQENGDI